MKVFFTSDLHFGHKNIIKFCDRPWPSEPEMDEGLIENWNKTVGAEDLIYILGDLFFCGSTRAKEIIRRLHGKKILILGNHDWKRIRETKADEYGLFTIQNFGTFELGERKIYMHHFPYRGFGDHVEGEERYSEHRLVNEGNWLLHGHIHNAWKIKEKCINVGVDVWNYFPVSLEQITDLIKDTEMHPLHTSPNIDRIAMVKD